MLPPLVQVVAPIARVAQCADRLHDALAVISSFVDPSSSLTSAEAAASGSLRLFDRVIEHHHDDPDLQVRALRIDAFTRAIASAMRANGLDIVQRIHQYHPGRLRLAVLQDAALADSVEMLQWLLENRAVDDPRWSAQYESTQVQHAQRDIVVTEVLWSDAHAGYRVCRWLFDGGFTVDPRSVVGKAMDNDDLTFLQSLPFMTRGHTWLLQSHLHTAIRRYGDTAIAARHCGVAV